MVQTCGLGSGQYALGVSLKCLFFLPLFACRDNVREMGFPVVRSILLVLQPTIGSGSGVPERFGKEREWYHLQPEREKKTGFTI